MRTWLREIRKSQNKSQEWVAEQVDISRVQYTRIENGVQNGSHRSKVGIAKALGFDWQRFYEEAKLDIPAKYKISR